LIFQFECFREFHDFCVGFLWCAAQRRNGR
jgi:hypothetical protein